MPDRRYRWSRENGTYRAFASVAWDGSKSLGESGLRSPWAPHHEQLVRSILRPQQQPLSKPSSERTTSGCALRDVTSIDFLSRKLPVAASKESVEPRRRE